MCPKGKSIEDAVVIGEGGLYELKGHSETTLVHEILAQVNYDIRGFLTSNTKHYPM